MAEAAQKAESCHQELIKRLDKSELRLVLRIIDVLAKPERKLVLRIIDAKDKIA